MLVFDGTSVGTWHLRGSQNRPENLWSNACFFLTNWKTKVHKAKTLIHIIYLSRDRNEINPTQFNASSI